MEAIEVIKQVIDQAVKIGMFNTSEDVVQVHQAYEAIKKQLNGDIPR